jgi:hypothetical protein
MHFMIGITCPQTKDEVSTGLMVDIKTFNEMPRSGARMPCSSCGQEHAWSIADAQLASPSHASDVNPGNSD